MRAIERVMHGQKDKYVIKPGGRVEEMGDIIKEQMEMCDPEAIILNVGVNNIGPRRSVELVNNYHSLLRKLREARKPAVITGILPRTTVSNEWHSRALAVNASVQHMCQNMGFLFIDLWGEFYGRASYYLGDGLHLSDEGARALRDAYRIAFQEN